MATKKATKVAKKATVKKTPAKKMMATPVAPKDDGIYWVLSERKFLTWKALYVYKSKAMADDYRLLFERNTGLHRSFKVDRVTLES